MKTKLLCLILLLIATNFVIAQSNSINYKAVISEDENVLANTSVILKFTILEDATTKYVETHTVTTDANGIAIANIGDGTPVTSTYANIDWSNNNHFLKTEVDTGNGFKNMGTTEFHAVPYAISGGSVKKLDDLSDASSSGKSVYVGQNSGRNSTGTYNSAFGYASLQSNTTGTYNVALGDFTLNANITGQKNTAIGDGAGYYSTGSGNIFIGQQAGYDYTGDNKLVIGKSRGSSLPIIEGDLSTNALTINGDITVTGTINGTAISDETQTNTITYTSMDIVNINGNSNFIRTLGTIYSNIPTDYFAVPIHLSEGTKITGIKAFFGDNTTANIEFKLYRTSKTSAGVYSLYSIKTSGASSSSRSISGNITSNIIINSNYIYLIHISNTDGSWTGNIDLYVKAIELTYEN